MSSRVIGQNIMQCGNCRYFWIYSAKAYEDWKDRGYILPEGIGDCRFNAPVTVPNTLSNFPIMTIDAWCGKWELKTRIENVKQT